MKRRQLLKTLGAGFIGLSVTPNLSAKTIQSYFAGKKIRPDDGLKDYLHKIQNFDLPHDDDVQIDPDLLETLESTVMRLRCLQKLLGHGNFNILNFTNGLTFANNYPNVGKFSKQELQFMENLFYADSQRYGFIGEKPLKEITDQINEKDVVKIPYGGNYLYKDRASIEIYENVKKELGDQVILTSGVRGIMKQFLLFLNKAYGNEGNLSLASRSIAPPGYSFHGNGDFDVGQAGYGKLNFTDSFTETEVYKRLSEMNYLQLRYPTENRLGVRFEPWHIKVNVLV